MTTKRKSSSKKSPAKKAVSKVKSTAKKAVKKATGKKSTVRKRASKRTKSSGSSKESHFSLPAFSLIDQAAGFIEKAVGEADRATAYERKAIRDNALSFIDSASKRLMSALDDDSSSSRKRR